MRLVGLKFGVLAVAVAAFGPASAQEVTWVYANGYAKNHPQVGVLADEMIAEIQKATNGRLAIRHVPDGSLLKPEEMLKGVAGHVANMGSTPTAFHASALPISATFGGLVDLELGNKLDLDKVASITASFITQADAIKQEYEKRGLKALWFVPTPAYVIVSVAPIEGAGDLSGKKVRAFGNFLPAILEAGNAVPLSVTFSELYTSLQTGLIDGAVTDPAAIVSGKLHEVAKHVTMTGPERGAAAAASGVAYFVNLEDWNKLPADLQAAVEQVCAEMTKRGVVAMQDVDAKALGELEAAGVKIHHLSDADVAALGGKLDSWTTAKRILGEAGLDGEAIVDGYLKIAREEAGK